MLEVSGRQERPTPAKAVARKSVVPARRAAHCACVSDWAVMGGADACGAAQGRCQGLQGSAARHPLLGSRLNGLHGSIAGKAAAHLLGCLQMSSSQVLQDQVFQEFEGFLGLVLQDTSSTCWPCLWLQPLRLRI